MRPEIYVEFSLVFENDFDVTEITKATGIVPYEYRKRTHKRLNPLTNKPLEGFWTVKSNVYWDFDIEKALNDIMLKIRPQITNIINICEKHDGEADFCIIATFEPSNKPAIYFNRAFLDMVHELCATIQIDMYINHEETGGRRQKTGDGSLS